MKHLFQTISKEAKKFQKEVAIPKEIERLQKMIDGLGLSNHFIIKKLVFETIKSSDFRTVCIIFKERYASAREYFDDVCIDTMNHFIRIIPVRTNTVHESGLFLDSYLSAAGPSYDVFNPETFKIEHVVNEDLRKIADLIINEYWLWLLHIDKRYVFWRGYTKQEIDYLPDVVYAEELDKLYQKYKIITNGKTPSMPMSTLVEKFNEQVSKGLIIDARVPAIPYPDHTIKQYEIEELKRGFFI